MSTAKVEAHPKVTPTQTDGSAPRKRRKRAPAAGAADDCFTCSTRSVKCDRRRPYCSKCLEDGKDCAGYKTQLTWGNGVASRGKLRGLSLPVAGTQKIVTPVSPSRSKRRPSQQQQQQDSQPRAEAKYVPPPKPEEGATRPPTSSDTASKNNAGSLFDQSKTSFQTFNSYTTSSLPSASARSSHAPGPIKIESTDTYASTSSTSLTSPLDTYGFSVGFSPNIGYNATASPTSYTTSPDTLYFGRGLNHGPLRPQNSLSSYPLSPQIPSPYDSALPDQGHIPQFQSQKTSYVHNDPYAQTLQPQHLEPVAEQGHVPTIHEDVEEIDRSIYDNEYDNECAVVDDDSTVGFPQFSFNYNMSLASYAGMGAITSNPRMQYLINYYTEVISPVIVAFDGPSNPYRTQILRLAARSETLQHAIAALSASNLRQRRETGAVSTGKTDPARRSSIAHLTLTQESWQDLGVLSPQEQAREESLHKGIAIQSLNKQLADPVQRKDDSILATLLILCLFHICDSGVAKFQTQFAGVKKLLGMRQNDFGLDTKEAKWFIRMFTWFDAMTATVNDREGQLQGHHLDVSALSDEEWALENLAGCDGQLFKTIAKLGRLNVLSQGKPVEESPTLVSRPFPQMPGTVNLDYSNFDGNGWMRIVQDEDLFSSKTANPDVKAQFWREWREIRQTLQTWQLDTRVFDCSSPEAPLLCHDQRVDLANISESFRYSALLYTERLANPTVSSTDASIRYWVQKCLMYIKAVKSDVYLLWPLFITGSECVDEIDRLIIRERCLDIQKDSGFLNNKSCLELLEKVWRRYDENSRENEAKAEMNTPYTPGSGSESGFKFTTIMKMEGNEGEYIVV